jgi:hypothetical protein
MVTDGAQPFFNSIWNGGYIHNGANVAIACKDADILWVEARKKRCVFALKLTSGFRTEVRIDPRNFYRRPTVPSTDLISFCGS